MAGSPISSLASARKRRIGFQPVSEGGHLACRGGFLQQGPGWKPGLRNSQDGCSPFEVLVGMGAIILDGAVIGERSIIGAGALVTGGTVIPPGSLVLGSPGKVVRTLSLDEQIKVKYWAEKYVKGSRKYLER
jgi:hypothetical protein